MSGGFWYCQKTSLPSPFCNSSLSIALLTPLPVPSWWPEHEGAICHTVLIPARVLRARHSPLTRLGCHVCWLTGKVTSGDKRPQLESVTNLPSLLLFPLLSDFYTYEHACRRIHESLLEKSACYIYTNSLQRAHMRLIFSIWQQGDILTGKRVSRIEEEEEMERDRQSVVFPDLTIMRSMSNEGERQRPWHGPAHTGRSGEVGSDGRRGIDRNEEKKCKNKQ